MKEFLTPTIKQFLSNLPHLVWVCAPDGPCAYLSSQWVEYTGRAESEQLGYGWLEAIHPDDRQRVAEAWEKNAADETPFRIDFRIRRHDGTYRWFKTRALRVCDCEGRCKFWIGTNTDVQLFMERRDSLLESNAELGRAVSEHSRHLQQALVEAKSLSEALEEAQAVSKTGSWRLNVETGEVQWSRQLFETLGLAYSDQAPPFPTHKDLMTESSWASLNEAVIHTLQSGEPYALELEMRRPDGRRCVGLARARVKRSSDGSVSHLVGTFQDITELRVVRDRLAQAHETLKLATEGTGTGIWDWDTARQILKVDPVFARHFGMHDATAELPLASWFEFLETGASEQLEDQLNEAAREGLDFSAVVKTSPDLGPVKHIKVTGRPFEGGRRVVGLARDVTEDVLQELQLLEHQEALHRSNRDLENFAHAASHDLQTPLRAVCSCVEMLEEELADSIEPEVAELMGHISLGAERMGRLVRGLLNYSRVEQDMELTSVDLEHVLGSALGEVRSAERFASVKFEIKPLPAVFGSETMLVSVYKNLLENAIKYGADQVEIGIEGDQFYVRDNGIGMEAGHLENIFDLFRRLHTYDEYQGSGIGLSLCRRVVESHGGTIWAESVPGKGTTFWFTLGRVPAHG